MKVYQLIYTSVRYCLSDPELRLENKPGYRVYSCTQGLTANEIEEVTCFCGYKKSEKSNVRYSKTYADPEIPGLFPKTFRTFILSTGKIVALQTVFSGYDIDGKDANFFAHAFIFDEVDDGFAPEDYYGSEDFRTYLTEKEQTMSLVRYLPMKEDVKKQENLLQWIEIFEKEHKMQLSRLVEATVEVLTGKTNKTHICVSAETEEESDYYVLALKRLLPEKIKKLSGIATNNMYLPSEKQNQILLNATISTYNNIDSDTIPEKSHCIYVDFSEEKEKSEIYERFFEMTKEELNTEYERFGIDNIEKFTAWLWVYNNVNSKGIGKRLQQVKEMDTDFFKNRCEEIYENLNQPDMEKVKFEVLGVMNDNAPDFPGKSEEIIKEYTLAGFKGIVAGEPANMEGIFKAYNQDVLASHVSVVYSLLDEIMSIISSADNNEQQAMLILRMFSIIKQATGINTWKEFFKNDKAYMKLFVKLSAKVIINPTDPVTFIAPIIWTGAEFAETVAYFDSSTQDERIKKACRQFIRKNPLEDWGSYGITISKELKSEEKRKKDIVFVKKMLSDVGYVPFQRGKYQDLKFEVVNDIENNDDPLLLTRLLNAYYNWQMTELETESEQYAKEIKLLIMEMRNREKSCYNFVFPKLALEILSHQGGSFYDEIINYDTMDDSFWNWFYIGADKNKKNPPVFKNYEKVYKKNENSLRRLIVYKKLKPLFVRER